MPRGGNDTEDLEDLLLEEVLQDNPDLELEIDPATGARSWRRRSDGALHHPTEPARVLPDGTREWYQNDRLESIGRKPSRILPDGTREWHLSGELESIDSRPSRVLPDGTREWHTSGSLEGLPERPSRVLPDGTREWHLAGELESINGAPSRILPDGTREWHLSGDLESIDGAPSRILPDGTCEWHRAGVLDVIDDKPSRILPDGTCRWEKDIWLDRVGGPAIVCPTKESRDNNDGLLWAYYYGGRLRLEEKAGSHTIYNEEMSLKPCAAWAGDDPRLVFCEGHDINSLSYYYYVAHIDGRESLIDEDGLVLQATSTDGEILELGWQSANTDQAQKTRKWFDLARSKRRDLSEMKNLDKAP